MRVVVLCVSIAVIVTLIMQDPSVLFAQSPLATPSPTPSPTTTDTPVPSLTSTITTVSRPVASLRPPQYSLPESVWTIIGIVIGFLLNEASKLVGDWRDKRRQAKAVRAMLNIEKTLNLNRLREFWAQVTDGDAPTERTPQLEVALCYRLADTVLPPFRTITHDSLLPSLAVTLDEQEVYQVSRFYEQLARLEAIRTEIIDLKQEEKEDTRLREVPTEGGHAFGAAYLQAIKAHAPLVRRGPELLREYENIVTQLLSSTTTPPGTSGSA